MWIHKILPSYIMSFTLSGKTWWDNDIHQKRTKTTRTKCKSKTWHIYFFSAILRCIFSQFSKLSSTIMLGKFVRKQRQKTLFFLHFECERSELFWLDFHFAFTSNFYLLWSINASIFYLRSQVCRIQRKVSDTYMLSLEYKRAKTNSKHLLVFQKSRFKNFHIFCSANGRRHQARKMQFSSIFFCWLWQSSGRII